MNLISIPALQDNYIWILHDDSKHCVIVDPGVSQPVLDKLTELNLIPDAILLTHHHSDHTDGVAGLVDVYPDISVFGPQETLSKGAKNLVRGNTSFTVSSMPFQTIAVPGHTLGHVAYYCAPYLFCGDTLFSAGCGRIFEGTPQQMHHSLSQLCHLPDSTKICCAHEYTLSNLRFALSLFPQDHFISTYLQQIEALRQKGLSSLPSTLQIERVINPFLRCHDIDLQKKLGFSHPTQALWQVFAELRQRKDNF